MVMRNHGAQSVVWLTWAESFVFWHINLPSNLGP